MGKMKDTDIDIDAVITEFKNLKAAAELVGITSRYSIVADAISQLEGELMPKPKPVTYRSSATDRLFTPGTLVEAGDQSYWLVLGENHTEGGTTRPPGRSYAGLFDGKIVHHATPPFPQLARYGSEIMW